MHWPVPVVRHQIDSDRGPVLVTVQYQLASDGDRSAFLAAAQRLADGRGRDGAYQWGLFEDTAEKGRFMETFMLESWVEHLRQHQRVTHADRALQDRMQRLLRQAPIVTHLIAVEPGPERP
jgi:hypothetical protein